MGLPHVANGFDGKLVAYADESLALPHAGTSAAQRVALNTEEWRAYVPDAFETHFKAMFPGMKSPLELTRGASANGNTLAMEFCQLPRRDRETGTLFTIEQYRACAAYGVEASRWAGFELPGFERKPFGQRANASRLLWHGLVQPFKRTDKRGEWDPGILRDEPTFDLDLLCSEIVKAKVEASRVSVTTRASKLLGFL
jgi:hypothetical protein